MKLKIKQRILDVLFPKFCAGCGREGDYICDDCSVFVGEAPLIYPGQGLSGLVSAWEYQGIIKKLLSDIKYKKVSNIIEGLGEKAFKVIVNDVSRFSDFLGFLFSEDICITYVPMYKNKEKDRGFNQAELIAKEIGRITDKKIVPLLQKIKETRPQVELKREARLNNLKGAFRLRKQNFGIAYPCPRFARALAHTYDSKIQFPSPHSFSPRNILLVDDIWTTGATMRECCKTLKKAGVKKVWGFTLARTV